MLYLRGREVRKYAPCPKCNGKGRVISAQGVMENILTLGLVSLLDETDMKPCRACRGRGRVLVAQEVRIDIDSDD